jgi:uncharacterized protein (TIGR03083 family)
VVASLPAARHLEVLAESGARLATDAEAAGPAALVPTCPAWTVSQLLAHQGMVHRWAAAHLGHGDLADVPNQTDVARAEPDLLGWYRTGLVELQRAFAQAPDDVAAMVFLPDAPPPRRFWARRQAHETTIHGVDALAARLGRVPTGAEVGLDPDVAVDGIDELLCGFLPRGKRSKLDAAAPCVIAIEPTDAPRRWVLTVAKDEPLTVTTGAGAADATFAGTAAELYLGLWNRGAEFATDGRAEILATWRAHQRVTW